MFMILNGYLQTCDNFSVWYRQIHATTLPSRRIFKMKTFIFYFGLKRMIVQALGITEQELFMNRHWHLGFLLPETWTNRDLVLALFPVEVCPAIKMYTQGVVFIFSHLPELYNILWTRNLIILQLLAKFQGLAPTPQIWCDISIHCCLWPNI